MWSKLDDQFPDHPKVLRAGPLASWLYVCGTCYCNRLLTNGHIPLAHVRKLADVTNPLKLAAKLVEVGLWEEVEGGYQIHDFLDHNMSAEEAKQRQAETRKVRSDAGSKGAAARWQKDSKPDGNLPLPLPETVDGKTMAPNPNPLRDSFTEVKEEPPTPLPGYEQLDTLFDQFWEAYPERNGHKKGPKNDIKTRFSKVAVKEWPALVEAARNYAAYCQEADEYPVDPIRFFASKDAPSGLWREYREPVKIKLNGGSKHGKALTTAGRRESAVDRDSRIVRERFGIGS